MQHGLESLNIVNGLQYAGRLVIRCPWGRLTTRQAAIPRQEIKASRPPGGDPLQRSAAVIGMVPGQDATILAKLDTGMA